MDARTGFRAMLHPCFFVFSFIALVMAGCGDKITNSQTNNLDTGLTVRAFGAFPNDGKDDTVAIQAAIDSAQKVHGVLKFEAGSYTIRNNVYVSAGPLTIRGSGAGTVLEADPNSNAFETVLGLLVIGLNEHQAVSGVEDLLVEDMAIDGRFHIAPIFCTRSERCRFHRVTARSSNAGVCSVHLSSDIAFEECTVSGGRGKYGDGILFAGVQRPSAVDCGVSDVTRIGICTESDDPVLSENAYIVHNTIHYAHDSIGTEFNGAIWLEHTNGGIVSDNVAWDLDNNSAHETRGITLGGGVDRDCVFTLRDDKITRAAVGIAIGCGSKGNVVIDGLDLEVGDHFDYGAGIQVGAAGSVVIENCFFGDVAWTNESSGSVVVDLGEGMETLTVRDCRIGSRQYGQSADVFLYNLNGNLLENLVLSNLHGWKVKFNECPSQVYVRDCELDPPSVGCPTLEGLPPGFAKEPLTPSAEDPSIQIGAYPQFGTPRRQ